MEKLDKYQVKLIKEIRNFSLTDLLGIGQILGVEEQEEFNDYLTEIVIKFNLENRKRKKEILKFCRDISLANQEIQEKK